jgi:hypothetical protein
MARRFKIILDQFFSVSRGVVNPNKCYIYAWNTNAHSLAIIVGILHSPLALNWKFFKYMGIPICLSSLSADDWVVIISKIKDNSLSGAHIGSIQ